MDTVVELAVGTIVSVVLFIIGYRQTVGARKERIHTANSDLEQILMKRVVLESYTPTRDSVVRLIDGKARDHRVEPAELLAVPELLNVIFTRIVESDFITPEQRKQLLETLSAKPAKDGQSPIEQTIGPNHLDLDNVTRNLGSAIRSARRRRELGRYVAFMAILASVLGAIVSFIISFPGSDALNLNSIVDLLPSLIASLAVISTISAIWRYRESPNELEDESTLPISVRFAKEVEDALEDAGATFRFGFQAPEAADFVVELRGRTSVIRSEATLREPVVPTLQTILPSLQRDAFDLEASEAIIVTPNRVRLPELNSGDGLPSIPIHIMTVQDLRKHLARDKSNQNVK